MVSIKKELQIVTSLESLWVEGKTMAMNYVIEPERLNF